MAAFCACAHAGELVTLRNGFEVSCDHHAEADGRVRLFLSATEDNYLEMAPEEIAGVERVSDPPVTPGSAQESPARKRASSPDVRLIPEDLREMLSKAGHEHNLDADLLASLVKAESGGNARAVSRTGARGLMQLMPSTAAGLGVQDSFEPRENLRGGSTYLDALLVRYHDNLALALAAYNAGPAAVDKYHGIPPYQETTAYVAHVIHEFNRRVLAREAEAKRAASQARASNAGATP
jgi:hypothetical protein